MIALYLLRETASMILQFKVDFEDQDNLNVLRNLDINQAHSHDNISTIVIKI